MSRFAEERSRLEPLSPESRVRVGGHPFRDFHPTCHRCFAIHLDGKTLPNASYRTEEPVRSVCHRTGSLKKLAKARAEDVLLLLFRFQLLADAAQFHKDQGAHRTQHGSKHNHHHSIHRARAPPPLVNVSRTFDRCICGRPCFRASGGRSGVAETAVSIDNYCLKVCQGHASGHLGVCRSCEHGKSNRTGCGGENA